MSHRHQRNGPRVLAAALAGIAEPLHVADDGPAALRTVLWEAASPPADGDVVLCIGVDQAGAILGALTGAGARPAALLLASGCGYTAADDRVAARLPVAVHRITEGVDWTEAAAAVDGMFAGRWDPEIPTAYADIADGDLFSLANAICRLVDAPVTIEDRNTNVLAFSDRQQDTDAVRIASILHRTTPADYHETSGDAEFTDERPVFVPGKVAADGTEVKPRAVVAVRDGDRVLGTIWAVVPGPLDDERSEQLFLAATVAARHLRLLAGRSSGSAESALLRAVLDGSAEATAAAVDLGITWPATVLAISVPTGVPDDADLTGYLDRLAVRGRICSALSVHLRGFGIGTAMTPSDDVVHAVVWGDRDGQVHPACREFVALLGGSEGPLIGLGRDATDVYELTRSRQDADDAVRALRMGGRGSVGSVGELAVDVLMVELTEISSARGSGPSGAYARLLAYDDVRGGSLIETVRAWLDSFGFVPEAAARCGVHPNTFRYRMSRVAEVGEVDLTDPDQRFALALQVALADTARAVTDRGGPPAGTSPAPRRRHGPGR